MKTIDGLRFAGMVLQGASNLSINAKYVDALNVFPVPDGDTGTNMNLSITSGAKEVAQNQNPHIGKVATALSKGLLMGARGNSGVILSQLFRGFSKSIEGKETINTKEFADGLKNGVDTAYKAVLKPVEGTILTVAKDAANKAIEIAKNESDIEKFLVGVISEANASLKRTPDLLPVLKEVGVVDSGGQGLVFIYEGFLANLRGQELKAHPFTDVPVGSQNDFSTQSVQSHLSSEEIEFGYCTEFIILVDEKKVAKKPYAEDKFVDELSRYGDSLVVVSDDDVIKVHIHVEQPGEILNLAQRFGDLKNIKIENMREQHSALLFSEGEAIPVEKAPKERKPYGIVSVAMGSGIVDLFKNLGATGVIEGGQTMNPSTEDILNAVKKAHADHVFVLPNNKNIILAAQQAREVSEDVKISVIETKSIPQGLSAILAFNPASTAEENESSMKDASLNVQTGQITYAVRDTQMDGVDIRKDDFMGISEGKIVSTHQDKLLATKELLEHMIQENHEILTILSGEDASDEEVAELISYVEEQFEDVEVELYKGNQPLYSFIFALE